MLHVVLEVLDGRGGQRRSTRAEDRDESRFELQVPGAIHVHDLGPRDERARGASGAPRERATRTTAAKADPDAFRRPEASGELESSRDVDEPRERWAHFGLRRNLR